MLRRLISHRLLTFFFVMIYYQMLSENLCLQLQQTLLNMLYRSIPSFPLCLFWFEHFFFEQLIRFGLVIAFNLAMWGCFVNSLKALSSLQATGTNFSTNFLCSGLAGFFLFEEALSFQVNPLIVLISCSTLNLIELSSYFYPIALQQNI